MKRLTILLGLLLAGLGIEAQVSFSVSESEGCAPLPVIISLDTPDPATVTSFYWEITTPDNSIITSTSTEYIDIFSDAGTYDVSLTIDGTTTQFEQDFITVYAPPVANFTVDDPAGCVEHCVQFTDLSTIDGGEIIEWSWDFGNGTTSLEQNPSYCYQNAGTYSPVLSIEDEFGCFSSLSIPQMIFVSDDFPVAEFIPSSFSDCNPPVIIDFENTSTGNDLSAEWDFSDGFTQSTVDVTDISHTFDDIGTYDVCLTVTDDIGCAVEACETIEVITAPTPSFQVSETTVCAGALITFEDTSSPVPSSWSWDFDGDGVEDATGPTVSYEYAAPGNYLPVLTATYSDQCEGQSTGSVEVLEEINISFAADDPTSCIAPYTANFTNSSAGQNITSVEWLIDGVSVGFGDNLQYTFNDFGYYDVGLVVTTSSCTDSLVIEDYVIVELPSIQFDVPEVVCSGEMVVFTNVEITSVDPIVDYQWDFDEDGVVDAGGGNPTFVYTDPGEYTVQVLLTTVSGCTSTVQADQSILVQPNVVSAFTADNPISCAGEPITFCTSMEETNIYAWNFGDNTGWQLFEYPDSCVVHDYADTGYFDVSLSVYNLACNTLLVLEDYIYIPPPIADFEVTQNCADLLSVTFNDTSIEADSLVWDFGDGSPLVYNDPNPTHTYPAEGSYTVTLFAYNFETGCFDDNTGLVNTFIPDVPLSATAAQGCAPVEPNFSTPDYAQYQQFEVDFGNGTSMVATLNAQSIWEVYYTTPDGVDFQDYSMNANFFPDVVYTQGGYYDVTITATDESGCSFTSVYEDMVYVYNDLTFADFNPVVIEGCDSVLISFEPTGNFLDTYTWEFSDGTTSTELNPVHEFLPPWDTTFAATLNAVDVFGCGSIITHVLDLVAPPIPDFNIEVNPSCLGDTIAVSNNSVGDIVSYLWDFGDPQAVNNTSDLEDPEYVYENNGDFTVCLTAENSQGCQQTLCQQNAVSIVSPEAEFTFDSQINNCLFGVQFENTTPGNQVCSQWNFGDQQLGSGSDPFHTYPIGVYDVELVVCNEFGCYDTTTVNDIFNLSNVIGPYSINLDQVSCAPFQVSFEAFNIGDQSFTYFWEFDDGFGDPDNNTTTSHTYQEPGTYCPSLIMEDANGCPFLIECDVPFEVEEFTFEVSTLEPICFGDSTTVAFEGATSYDISHPELFTTIEPDSFYIQAPQTTDILITGYFEDCVYENPVTLTVNQLPNVTLDVVPEVCYTDEEFDLDGGLPAGPTGIYTLEGAETSTFDPSLPDNTSYEITYSFTDDNGCVNADTADIFINPLPPVSLNAIGPICENDDPLVLEGGLPLGGEYTVDGNLQTEFDPVFGEYGLYEVIYTYVDVNGCIEDDTVSVTVNANPVASFLSSDLCWLEDISVENTSTIDDGNIAQIDWDFGALGTQSNTDTPTIPADLPGVVDVTLTVTSDQGCTADSTSSFTVWATPIAQASTENVCLGEDLVFIDESTSTGEPITSWHWQLNGESYSGLQSPSDLNLSEWGTNDITLIVATNEGCSDTLDYQVDVFPNPEVAIDYEDICEGESLFISNLTTIPSTTLDSYTWTTGLGGGDLISESFSQVYPDAGVYDLSLTAVSSEGCTSTLEFQMSVAPTPVPLFNISQTEACQFAEVFLMDSSMVSEGYISTWMWTVNGELVSTNQDASLTITEEGDYDIALTVSTNEGCAATLLEENLLEIWPTPTADFNYGPDEPDTSTPIIFVTDQSDGALVVEYETSDGAFYVSEDFEHEFPGAGIYEVVQYVENSFGCSDSLLVEIEVQPTLIIHVPNAFTPDGDGVNETFFPVISGAEIAEYKFQIFNRWGETIFQSTELGTGWIGNTQGGQHFVPDGVYPWRIEVQSTESNELEVIHGHVTLLR